MRIIQKILPNFQKLKSKISMKIFSLDQTNFLNVQDIIWLHSNRINNKFTESKFLMKIEQIVKKDNRGLLPGLQF